VAVRLFKRLTARPLYRPFGFKGLSISLHRGPFKTEGHWKLVEGFISWGLRKMNGGGLWNGASLCERFNEGTLREGSFTGETEGYV